MRFPWDVDHAIIGRSLKIQKNVIVNVTVIIIFTITTLTCYC